MGNWIQDGGHGGKDSGAVAKGNTEKVYTLEAALYVNKRLAELGILSDVTRGSDVTLDQGPRTSKVKNFKKCISHHFNAGGGSGVETIHSIYADGKFENTIIEEFKKAGFPVRPRPVYFKKYGNGDYYYMHRGTGACRTTIVEYDFVDGPQSEKIKSKAYREGMYECVVRAICRDKGKVYKAPGQKEEPKPDPKPQKSIDQLAQEVIKGLHGSGDARRKSLGAQYDAVQTRVNQLLGAKPAPKPQKTISQLADEVIRGLHGTGAARQKSLGANYAAVQAEVNRRLK